ncbi:universal stress protein [Aurantibacter sp.]|uniref:universal stress protein n=1 Tax=Aurantibacter sp. TaxID=2807103 RepID=UPI0032656F44
MRTILIPTDFSDNALHAVNYAVDLFKCERVHFYFLHAYADEVYGPYKSKNNEEIEIEKKKLKKQTEKKLDTLIDQIQDVPPNPRHSYEGIAVFDALVDAVNDQVNEINIDMVVMGTKGKSNDKKIIFGSHTVQLFKYVKCPVLAVPNDADFEQPKKILFPTNYMLPYKRRELKLLNCLSGEYKSEIHCLYISDFDNLSARQIDNRRFLSDGLPNSYLFFEQTSVKNKTKAIQEYIEQKHIDFLVMVNSRHSFLEDLLYRSTVDEIGLTTKIPFLVLQNLSR